jgi:hypothetical protein
MTENLWHVPLIEVFVGGRTSPLIAANRRTNPSLNAFGKTVLSY